MSHSAAVSGDWSANFARMASEWNAQRPPRLNTTDVGSWDQRYGAMVDHEHRLRTTGAWVSGPSDLLHVLGIADLELRHSRIVAWLLDPTARHRLGARLLETIFRAGWPMLVVPPVARAVVREEVVAEHRRADIVVRAGDTTLVIENKIWAPESTDQSEDLFQLWSGGGDVRYLFLTLDGREPRQLRSTEARTAWRTLSYRALASWLQEQVVGTPQSTARGSVEQYAATLRRLAPGQEGFGIHSGGDVNG